MPKRYSGFSVQIISVKNHPFYWGVFFAFGGLLIAADQWLKWWSSANLAGQPKRVLLDGLLGLTYFHNPGMAFGLLGNFSWGRWVIVALVSLMMLGVLWYYYQIPRGGKTWWMRVPLIFVFAGGIGNLIDRFRLGYVVDMLEFLFMDFAIFNLADVFVTTGVFLLIPVLLIMGKSAPWPFGTEDNKS